MQFVDSTVMPGHAQQMRTSLPPYWENPRLPGGYMGSGRFAGPALLWLVVFYGHSGRPEWAPATIRLMFNRGADPDQAKRYLEWNPFQDTWPVKELRTIIR